MPLTVGSRLGVYEVVAFIGAGGMGEVYRARDTKLGRDVAVKVLLSTFASDPDRLARFQREAQVLASLNHPNIAAIHGFEEAEGIQALVLEFVEGDTLGERIDGGLPLDEALDIARQIADALEAAHEQGLVHRDLKPANIKVRPDGVVKVLDFGLAKLAELPGTGTSGALNTMSPTLSLAATRAGIILGTAAYMAPEQVRGKPADRRADNWAFGCVLYEMLTGRRPFDGGEISDTLAFVLTREPDWTALPAETPAPIRRLLRWCLEKDRAERLQHIGDARLEIKEALSPPAEIVASVQATVTPPPDAGVKAGVRRWLPVTATAVFLITTLALAAALFLREAQVDVPLTRFFISPPDGWRLTFTGTVTGAPGATPAPLTVSPDGRRVAFLANATTGRSRLWVRALDTLEAQELPGTDGASGPFWSPDSRSLGFHSDGKLKRIDVAGGPAITLCNSEDYRGGAWSQHDVIVFAAGSRGPLQTVSASGGIPAAVTKLAKGETGHARPGFFPDGRHFSYFAFGRNVILVGSLDSTDATVLLDTPSASNVVYSRGHLLFLRETTLMAQPFDLGRLALTGEPVPIAEQIQTHGAPPNGLFSSSETGVLVYQTGRAVAGSQLTWFDRNGRTAATVGDRAPYGDVELSPDAARAAVTLPGAGATANRDIWLVELARGGVRTRLTSDPGNELSPIWSPDGSRIVFDSDRKGSPDLYQKPASGVGTEDAILEAAGIQRAFSWSPDGRHVLYHTLETQPGTSGNDLWVLPLVGDKKPFPFLQTMFNELLGRLSPDGRWASYDSDESGRLEVYVAPFPKADAKVLVSTAGGLWARWRRDGREIFYVDPENRLMAAEVDGQGTTFKVGAVRSLFTMSSAGQRYAYDVSPDGQRVLVNTVPEQEASATPITVVLNWTAGFKK